MKEALIPRDIHKSYAPGFTAYDFDPQYIVSMARNAATGYIVFKCIQYLDSGFLSSPVLEEGFRFIDDTLYLDALAAKFTGNYYIGDWENKPALFWYSGRPVKYKLVIPENGRYGIAAELAAFFNGSVSFRFDKITGEIESHVLTGYNSVTPNGHANFEWQDMGEIYLSAGTYEVTIESKQQDSWLKLRQFRITAL